MMLKQLFALVLATLAANSFAQHLAPPPAPPAIDNTESPFRLESFQPAAIGTLTFSVGEPTDEEQLYLELINRARTNANAEATRLLALPEPSVQFYYTNVERRVDTNLMKAQFATNPPVAPLSFNAKLIAAARAHTQYQFENGIQSHFGPGNNDLGYRLRVTNINYQFRSAGENVYSYVPNIEVGHAGFEVEWSNNGSVNGGMQLPPGHRDNIHAAKFTEIGVGVVFGTNQVGANPPVGPQLVTQNFGLPLVPLTYITGVAYYDINGNNFYDVGEGLGGINVNIDGWNTNAVTSYSGAYSIPVAPGGNYSVTFSGRNLRPTSRAVSLNGTNNFKLDFTPAYAAATLNRTPTNLYAGVTNYLQVAPFIGATGYRAQLRSLVAEPNQGAENGQDTVTITKFGDYNPISTTVFATGTRSFHLGHRSGSTPNNPEIIRFNSSFYVRPNARVDFKTRMGIASPNEQARLEVSENNGSTWQTLWSQNGIVTSADTSEKSFTARTQSLAAYVGKEILVRFVFSIAPNSSFFPLPANGAFNFDFYGFYVDDILFTNAEHPSGPAATTLSEAGVFAFQPPAPGEFLVNFQPLNGARLYPAGPNTLLSAIANPPTLAFTNSPVLAANSITLTFDRQSGAGTNFVLESAADVAGPWNLDATAQFTGGAGPRYTVTATLNGSARYYRVSTK